jgi:hypothetical protein
MKQALLVVVLLHAVLGVQGMAQLRQAGPKLVGTGAIGPAGQGSVSISGDGNTVIAGGFADYGFVGAAWIFARSGNVWTQQGPKLVGTGTVGAAYIGGSVSLSSDGNTAVVGGSSDNNYAGAVWIFTRTAGMWAQQGSKILGTGTIGSARFGFSAAISADGNTIIVGGPDDDSGAGAAWIFARNGSVWTQQGSKLVGTGAVGASQRGISVSISADGNTAIVGGPNDNTAIGAAWVFTRSGGVWTQQGSKLVGTGFTGSAIALGNSVSLSTDGNIALVGGPVDNGAIGATWVFTRTAGVWTQQGPKLVGTGSWGQAYQGASVSISSNGNTVLVGGFSDNNYAGAVWIFTRNGGAWVQQGSKLVAAGAVGGASQGQSVSICSDGNTAIVGGPGDSSFAGASWVYMNASPTIKSVEDLKSDQGGTVAVNWDRSPLDGSASSVVTDYCVWRGIRSSTASPNIVVLNKNEYLAAIANRTVNPEMFMSTQGANALLVGDIYWQYVISVPSHGFDHYSYAVPTLADSTTQGIPWRYFIVTAATNDANVFWDSPPDSGYSVDNLAPVTPGGVFLATLSNAVRLQWNFDRTDPDVGRYIVYRSTTNGFPIADSTRLLTTTDSTVVDSSAIAGQTYYYRITTADIHGNESVPTPQIASAVTSFGETGAFPTAFSLHQNFPDPFNPATTITYELPATSHVTLTIYNTMGQEIVTLINGVQDAGYKSVMWNAQNLASGFYFYRIMARSGNNVFTGVRKMLVLK